LAPGTQSASHPSTAIAFSGENDHQPVSQVWTGEGCIQSYRVPWVWVIDRFISPLFVDALLILLKSEHHSNHAMIAIQII
jgi:hypothetical protein